jgi:hypothetical protein
MVVRVGDTGFAPGQGTFINKNIEAGGYPASQVVPKDLSAIYSPGDSKNTEIYNLVRQSGFTTSIAPLAYQEVVPRDFHTKLYTSRGKRPPTVLQKGARFAVKEGVLKPAAKKGIEMSGLFPSLFEPTIDTFAPLTLQQSVAQYGLGSGAAGAPVTGYAVSSSLQAIPKAPTNWTSVAGTTPNVAAGIGIYGPSTTASSFSSAGSLAAQADAAYLAGKQATAGSIEAISSLEYARLMREASAKGVGESAAVAAADKAAMEAAKKGGEASTAKLLTPKNVNTALVYIQIGYDVYKFIDEPGPATGGAVVGAIIGTILTQGNPLGTAVGSFVGGFIGSLFGGGNKRYRRERQQRAFSGTAAGKVAFNTQRVRTATGGDNTTVVAVIEDDAYYHQGSGRYSQPITLPITTGNPQGFLDLEHRSAQELVQGLIGQNIDDGSGFGSAGRFLGNTQTASLGARTIDMFLRKMGKTDKADEFKEEVFKHEGNFYDSQPNIVPHTLDRDFNFLGEDRLKGPSNSGASIQVFDNRFGITQDVIYGKAVAGRSKIQRRSETFPPPRTSQLRMFGRRAKYG